jgi:hypothetical protein
VVEIRPSDPPPTVAMDAKWGWCRVSPSDPEDFTAANKDNFWHFLLSLVLYLSYS